MNTSLDKYLLEGMKRELKERVYNDILNELVEQFKKDIEPHLIERFEKISIESVEQYRDLLKITDEINVLVKGVENQCVTNTAK